MMIVGALLFVEGTCQVRRQEVQPLSHCPSRLVKGQRRYRARDVAPVLEAAPRRRFGDIAVERRGRHHCYRERQQSDDAEELKGDDKDEAKKNNEAARLWISGIEAVKRKVGVRAVTISRRRHSSFTGLVYAEGTLFPGRSATFH